MIIIALSACSRSYDALMAQYRSETSAPASQLLIFMFPNSMFWISHIDLFSQSLHCGVKFLFRLPLSFLHFPFISSTVHTSGNRQRFHGTTRLSKCAAFPCVHYHIIYCPNMLCLTNFHSGQCPFLNYPPKRL